MARVKVSDLEITKRKIPLLVYVEPRTVNRWDDPALPVLHICRRDGTMQYRSGSKKRYNVTECNRPLEYINVYHRGKIDTSQYRLCSRCAKEQGAFEGALANYHKCRERLDQHRKETEKQKQQERQKERGALRARLSDFGSMFFEEAPASWIGPTNLPYAFRVEYKGRLYEIKEVSE